MPGPDSAPITVSLPSRQINLVDQFRREKALASREAAIALLLDIALEATSSRGRRFWDARGLEQERCGGGTAEGRRTTPDQVRALKKAEQ